MSDSTSPTSVHLDRIDQNDLSFVANWISETNELPFISSYSKGNITPLEFTRWVDEAAEAIVARHRSEAVAFATLTNREVECGESTYELCHLIVHPEHRRRYHASHLVLEICNRARSLGIKRLIGRVVETNVIGLAVINSLRWNEISPEHCWPTEGLRWFQRSLEKE